ncbi:MAG: exopolyphosphatase [Deltaproteobacteria bacterium]|nr:exopolyphosphatase [Deltaproteobacteria bacterium]
MRAAAIDVGTNTVRLLVADCGSNQVFTPVLRREQITRLGGGFTEGRLSQAAIKRTVESLKNFQGILKKSQAETVFAVGTSVVRNARNRIAFIETVRRETGIEIHPVSGLVEARLAARGALLPVNDPDDSAFIFDIGGGSTEFIFTSNAEVLRMETIDLGVVHLTEHYLLTDPPRKGELTALKETVYPKVAAVRENFQSAGFYPFSTGAQTRLIGIAGTPTTLAAIDLRLSEYDRGKVTNHCLTSDRIRELFEDLTKKRAEERLLTPGLQKGREDLIIPGIIIVEAVMDLFGFAVLRVVDSGILEGILLSIPPQEHQSLTFRGGTEANERKG